MARTAASWSMVIELPEDAQVPVVDRATGDEAMLDSCEGIVARDAGWSSWSDYPTQHAGAYIMTG